MSVRKRGNKYVVVHCHGKDKGKAITEPTTKEKADAIHRAIQANKKRKKR